MKTMGSQMNRPWPPGYILVWKFDIHCWALL